MRGDFNPQHDVDVRIVEVGPRDGLQNISSTVPTSTKIELIKRLRASGLRIIELTSAVSPRAVPQLADNQEVLSSNIVQSLLRESLLQLPVLVPNRKGLESVITHGVAEVAVFVSATEGFSRANINCTVDEGLRRASKVAQVCKNLGLKVRGYISCIFADPYDGPTKIECVLHGVQKLLAMGCYEVSLGDTLGVGVAEDVQRLLSYLFQHGVPVDKLAGHFHDTYGQAIGNVCAAFKLGIRTFDSSVGGLGGCPFAPGARGNVATEDLVYFFEQAGVRTGVDILKLAETGAWISHALSKQNDSRAGAALANKHKLFPFPAAPIKQPDPRIPWSLTNRNEELQVFRSGPNVKVVLNRPKNGNALTESMASQLIQVYENAATDRTITRIVITANGKFFCTGMNLGKDTAVAKSKRASKDQFELLRRLFDAIDGAPQVTIAAINGPAFGGGVGLAFACDIRIGIASATVTLSEVKLGLAPATISKFVARECGPAFTREAMLSARPIPLSELWSLGLVAIVVDDREKLEIALDQYLHRLKAAAPRASALCKDLVRFSQNGVGGTAQAEGIHSVFDEMMRPDGESAYGLKEFQAGNKKVDWDTFALSKPTPKL